MRSHATTTGTATLRRAARTTPRAPGALSEVCGIVRPRYLARDGRGRNGIIMRGTGPKKTENAAGRFSVEKDRCNRSERDVLVHRVLRGRRPACGPARRRGAVATR